MNLYESSPLRALTLTTCTWAVIANWIITFGSSRCIRGIFLPRLPKLESLTYALLPPTHDSIREGEYSFQRFTPQG